MSELFRNRQTNRPGLVSFQPALRLLVLTFLIVLLQPNPTLVTLGQTQQVHTLHPVFGVHTRLTDEVEPWKIQRTMQLVREMGAGWIVEFFPWAYYHAKDGGFAWEHPDLVVEHASAQGLKVIARLGLTPAWARPPDTPLTYLDASAYEHFAAYAAAFAERYRGKVNHIIIGNEPNLSYEWGYQKRTAEEYVALLKTIYPAVKSVSPQTMLLGGALAPNLEPADSPWATSDLDYLRGMYEAGAASYFDGLAVHAYGLTFPPDSEPMPGVLNYRRVELVRQIMNEYGDQETPIFISESGWNDHPRWTLAVSPAQRIQFTLDALSFAEQQWPTVQMVAIWAFRYPAATKSYPDYYTLLTPEFVRKPIYEALKAFTGNLPG